MPTRSPSLVSVVLAVLNGEEHFAAQLESLVAQQLDVPWELVVADNGSTDRTVEVARAYASRVPHFVLVDAGEKRGKQHALRCGVAASRGDLLAFVDHDDVCAPGWLAALVAGAADVDAVSGSLELHALNDDAEIAARPWVHIVDRLPVMLGGIPFPHAGNWAVWRDAWEAIDGPEADLPEWAMGDDRVTGCCLVRAGKSLGFAPDAVVHYRLRPVGAATRRQMRLYGRADPVLLKRYRDVGVRSEPLGNVLPRYASVAPRALRAWLKRDDAHWARSELAYGLGRLEASIRCRVLCL